MWLVVLAVGVFLGVVLVKPWVTPPTTPVEAGIASQRPVASPAFAVIRIQPAPVVTPVWPAAAVASKHAASTATEAEGALGELALHAGAWGVGAAGVGPRMLRDEPWTDWAAVTPESVDGGPLHILMWPGTSLCDGYPTINDRPSLVAVTTAADLEPSWRLVGWWTDGGKVGASGTRSARSRRRARAVSATSSGRTGRPGRVAGTSSTSSPATGSWR